MVRHVPEYIHLGVVYFIILIEDGKFISDNLYNFCNIWHEQTYNPNTYNIVNILKWFGNPFPKEPFQKRNQKS